MSDPTIPALPVEVLLFAVLSIAALAGAIGVVRASDPFISALSLLANFASLGAMYLMLRAPFVAVAQVIVYAGAVVVLFLFVIAYLGDRRELPSQMRRALSLQPLGMLAGVAMLAVLGYATLAATYPNVASVANPDDTRFAFGSVYAIGELFLRRYVLEFEVTSLLLLVAAIGGIVLGLTGRTRHDRLRRMLNTESADQHKRRAAHGALAAPTAAAGGASDGPAAAITRRPEKEEEVVG